MRFKKFLNEGRISFKKMSPEEIAKNALENYNDKTKTINYLKNYMKNCSVGDDTYKKIVNALEILSGNNYISSKTEEPKPQEKVEKTSEKFDLENFTVKKKKTSENKADVIINGIVVGEYSQRRDYVKRKSTDRLRTKMATIRSLYWNSNGLSELLGKKIKVGNLMGYTKFDYDFYNMTDHRSPIENEYIKKEFKTYAKLALKKGE